MVSVGGADWSVLCCADNEASAGAAEQQQREHRAEAERPAGAGVHGSSSKYIKSSM